MSQVKVKFTEFEADIHGLRGLAALLVFLFHSKFFDLFRFGYLGVDVFICLSGYVMASFFSRNRQLEFRSLLDFYNSRFYRIYPMLIVSVLITILLSYIFQPILSDFKPFAFSLLGISNIFFDRTSTDYWMQFDDTSWLLHTWSVSLEIQLYLLIGLILLFKWTRFRLFLMMTLVFASFAVYLSINSPDEYPFLLNQRFWQFGIGYLSFYAARTLKKSRRCSSESYSDFHKTLLITLRISLFAACISSFALSARVGVCLVFVYFVCFGLRLNEFLSRSNFFQLFGSVSYSFYLLHFPIIKIFNNYFSTSLVSLIVEFAIIFGLSWFANKYIENFFRDSRSRFRRTALCFLSISAVVSLILYNSASASLNELVGGDNLSTNLVQRQNCHVDNNRQGLLGYFEICSPSNNESILFLGDSYAQVLSSAFTPKVERDVSVFSSGACDFALRGCRKEILNSIAESRPSLVVVTQQWAGKVFPKINVFPFNDLASCSTKIELNLNCPQYVRDRNHSVVDLYSYLESFSSLGVKRVVVVGQSPEFPFQPKSCLRQSFARGWFLPTELKEACNRNYRNFQEIRSGDLNTFMRSRIRTSDFLYFVDPTEVLCSLKVCRIWSQDRKLNYADSIHLSPAGARKVSNQVEAII